MSCILLNRGKGMEEGKRCWVELDNEGQNGLKYGSLSSIELTTEMIHGYVCNSGEEIYSMILN